MPNVPNVKPESREITKEFRDYVYGVSHDVGAPARAMAEFSRLLADEHTQQLSEDAKLYLSLIIENGEKLQNMMDGLLEYSRLNTETRAFISTSAAEACKNALFVLSDIVEKKGAIIDMQPLPDIYGDPTQLWQLFRVLLDNALKFQSPSNIPRIKIEAQRQSNGWKFSIADNGIGINNRFREKIFGVFQRLHTGDDYAGVGMGLTLAQRIVHRHGGEIWVEGAPDQGSVFCFTIPVQEI